MKKQIALFYALACMVFGLSSCWHSDHNINIKYKDTGRYYSMDARFSKNKTREVEDYMNDRLGKGNHRFLKNTSIDGQLVLDDRTSFYIHKYPGYIEIKLDKDKNSEESFHKIKAMCEGIKEVLTR